MSEKCDLCSSEMVLVRTRSGTMHHERGGMACRARQTDNLRRQLAEKEEEIACLSADKASLAGRLHAATQAGTPYSVQRDEMNALVFDNARLTAENATLKGVVEKLRGTLADTIPVLQSAAKDDSACLGIVRGADAEHPVVDEMVVRFTAAISIADTAQASADGAAQKAEKGEG